jgi:hypothetical protein
MIQPKSQNYKIGHDGILSIGNFILVIKNQILLFQLTGNTFWKKIEEKFAVRQEKFGTNFIVFKPMYDAVPSFVLATRPFKI